MIILVLTMEPKYRKEVLFGGKEPVNAGKIE